MKILKKLFYIIGFRKKTCNYKFKNQQWCNGICVLPKDICKYYY